MQKLMTITKPRNIWCVGRNYKDHAKEMNVIVPKEPLFFLKAGGCYLDKPQIELPSWGQDIHHELEIALLIQKNSDRFYFEKISLALDLTERAKQSLAKKAGEPWTLAKSFSQACPVGLWLDYSEAYLNSSFRLTVNQEIRQIGHVKDMLFNPEQLLKFATSHFPVEPGDILLTGTPSGVAALKSGDNLTAEFSTSESFANDTILTCHWSIL